jgi:hypothetical protein
LFSVAASRRSVPVFHTIFAKNAAATGRPGGTETIALGGGKTFLTAIKSNGVKISTERITQKWKFQGA